MALTDVKELAGHLARILDMERDPVEYWRTECLTYWRRYLQNRAVIDHLRRQNRVLRNFLVDIIPRDVMESLKFGTMTDPGPQNPQDGTRD